MSLTKIPYNTPHYLISSTELTSGSLIVDSMLTIGGLVYLYDLQTWKQILPDKYLVDFVWNTDGTGGSGVSGSYIATSGSSKYSVNSLYADDAGVALIADSALTSLSATYSQTSVSATTSTSAITSLSATYSIFSASANTIVFNTNPTTTSFVEIQVA